MSLKKKDSTHLLAFNLWYSWACQSLTWFFQEHTYHSGLDSHDFVWTWKDILACFSLGGKSSENSHHNRFRQEHLCIKTVSHHQKLSIFCHPSDVPDIFTRNHMWTHISQTISRVDIKRKHSCWLHVATKKHKKQLQRAMFLLKNVFSAHNRSKWCRGQPAPKEKDICTFSLWHLIGCKEFQNRGTSQKEIFKSTFHTLEVHVWEAIMFARHRMAGGPKRYKHKWPAKILHYSKKLHLLHFRNRLDKGQPKTPKVMCTVICKNSKQWVFMTSFGPWTWGLSLQSLTFKILGGAWSWYC